jgi:hypothetical protein
MNVTRESYYQTVRDMAEQTLAEIESDEETDYVEDLVASSAWVIYTAGNLAVIQHSDNYLACDEEMGLVDFSKGFGPALPVIALFAMRRDVLEQIDDLRNGRV